MTDSVDLLVVGGGISGAGVALQAVQQGWRVMLVERDDFASGSSSNSSKLVHGGLRYLKQGALSLTRDAVQAREQLLREAPGLVQPLPFLMPHHAGSGPAPQTLQLGLRLYDRLAGRRTRAWRSAQCMPWRLPAWRSAGLLGASGYEDASTDDARLTLRLLQEARQLGAHLHPRCTLEALERDAQAQVVGARLRGADGFSRRVATRCVIACAGAWLGSWCPAVKLRPLRGSHLLLPAWRLPLPCAAAWSHPEDGRPVFAYPWLGAVLVGTTDVDHELGQSIAISANEQRYLLAGLAHAFPTAGVAAGDVRSTWAGVRPVIASGQSVPSKESREHLVQADRGLVALGGGKLTTFHSMARAALQAAAAWLPAPQHPPSAHMLPPSRDGVWGVLGAQIRQGERLPGTQTLISEVRHSLQHEQVHHLDDLLLRRTRLGLLQARHGLALLPLLQPHCHELLGWSAERFAQEAERYQDLVRRQHSLA